MLEGVTISVAVGKGLNPATLLKMTLFIFIVKKKTTMKLSVGSIFGECAGKK